MTLEENLFHYINDLSGHSEIIDFVMRTLSDSLFWTTMGAILVILSFRLRRPVIFEVLLGALIALSFSDLISFEIIKPLVARERPCWLITARLMDGKCGGSYGFTSNHAANAFAVWTIVARSCGLRSWQSLLTLTVATLVALSRVYLGVHFVGDILGGALLGVLVASSLWALGLQKITRAISKMLVPRSR